MKKKLYAFQLSFILIFIIFLITILIPKNYTKEYKVGEINVSESYDKENKAYYFTFNYNNITLDYLIESKYKQHRTLIEDIEIIKDDNNFCIIPKSSKFTYESLCYQNEIITHYTNVNKTLKEKLKITDQKEKKITTFNDIEVYNNEHTYLLWNYNGFYYLNKTENKKIDILDKEIYT